MRLQWERAPSVGPCPWCAVPTCRDCWRSKLRMLLGSFAAPLFIGVGEKLVSRQWFVAARRAKGSSIDADPRKRRMAPGVMFLTFRFSLIDTLGPVFLMRCDFDGFPSLKPATSKELAQQCDPDQHKIISVWSYDIDCAVGRCSWEGTHGSIVNSESITMHLPSPEPFVPGALSAPMVERCFARTRTRFTSATSHLLRKLIKLAQELGNVICVILKKLARTTPSRWPEDAGKPNLDTRRC